MNCRRAQELLHLDRPGERTGSEQSALDDHLRHCTDCLKESEAIARTQQAMSMIRAEKLSIPDHAAAIAGIFSELPEQPHPLSATIGDILDRLNRPVVRFAYALLVIITTIGLISQFMNVAEGPIPSDRVASERSRAVQRPLIVYSVDVATARSVNTSGLVPVEALITGGSGERRIELRQDEVTRLLSLADQYLVRSLGISPEIKSQVVAAVLQLTREANISVRLHTSGKRQ